MDSAAKKEPKEVSGNAETTEEKKKKEKKKYAMPKIRNSLNTKWCQDKI